jgi:hypothetical protein
MDVETLKLGKQDHVHDDRTLMLGQYLEVPVVPTNYDFDSKRAKFPNHMWGNDQYGDCVIASESNHLLRMERIEQKRTIMLTDDDCINRYKEMTGCQNPGDGNDTGLVMLNAMKNWRTSGYQVKKKSYNIAAFGELDPIDDAQLRAAVYLLGGIHFGFALPLTARVQTNDGFWDVSPNDPGSEAGSWGGHAVFSCKYDAENIYVKSWEAEIRVTNAFVHKYADEVWGAVDDLDRWRKSDNLDVQGLIDKLHQIGAHNVQQLEGGDG